MQRRTIVWLVLHAWVRWKRFKHTQHLFTLLLVQQQQHDKVCGHFSTPVIHELSSDIISACAPVISTEKCMSEWSTITKKMKLLVQFSLPRLIARARWTGAHFSKRRWKVCAPVLAVLIQNIFYFLSSKQTMCVAECVCVRVSIIVKSYISENSMCVLDSLLNRD